MKKIDINRKRLGVSLVIIGLILVLFALQGNFDNDLKKAALINSDLINLKKYSALNDKFIYNLPEEWTSKENDYNVSEILYSNNFSDKALHLHGYVEIWNDDGSLKTFVERSKDYGMKDYVYNDYVSSLSKLNNRESFQVTYTMESEKVSYNVYEYFINLDESIVKFSFFVDKNKNKENYSLLFKTIVETFSYKE
ncbi:hypothetical protein [Clostridium sp.]|uniref:hypothetical protein n=1 Tax=Clostridium sp. TaxID=1506 RepID=UPI003464D987